MPSHQARREPLPSAYQFPTPDLPLYDRATVREMWAVIKAIVAEMKPPELARPYDYGEPKSAADATGEP